MPGTIPTLYLDTCIFLARFNDETYRDDVLLGIQEIFADFERGANSLVTSAITIAEILQIKSPKAVEFLAACRGRRRFAFVSVDPKVAEIAAALRMKYKYNVESPGGRPKEKMLSTPDSLHLACALAFPSVETFVTLDNRGRSDSSSLVQLGEVEHNGVKLKVRKPPLNPSLFTAAFGP